MDYNQGGSLSLRRAHMGRAGQQNYCILQPPLGLSRPRESVEEVNSKHLLRCSGKGQLQHTHTLPSQFIIHCSQQLCASKHYWSQKQNASVKQMHMQCHDATQTPATKQCTECMRHSSRETERWRTQRHGTAWFVN